jgi:choline-glycine betaine transporter
VITAESISPEAEKAIKKSKKYKSYKWGIHGWSAHRVVAYDFSKHKLLYNHRGEELKEIFSNIF